jgi:hypothetical protein
MLGLCLHSAMRSGSYGHRQQSPYHLLQPLNEESYATSCSQDYDVRTKAAALIKKYPASACTDPTLLMQHTAQRRATTGFSPAYGMQGEARDCTIHLNAFAYSGTGTNLV